MLTALVWSSAYASVPSEAEAWLVDLRHAIEVDDRSWLREAFAELFARMDGLTVDALRFQLLREMEGKPKVECRGPLCRVRFMRPDDNSELVIRQVQGTWRLWDESFDGHVDGPVTAAIGVVGSGEVEVRVNGAPTFLFDPIRGHESAALDRYLTPGTNVLTLVPRGEVWASLRIDDRQRELLAYDGDLEAARSFTFVVAPGSKPLPK